LKKKGEEINEGRDWKSRWTNRRKKDKRKKKGASRSDPSGWKDESLDRLFKEKKKKKRELLKRRRWAHLRKRKRKKEE